MAKDRVQVPDLYKDRTGLPQIAAVARPVDTFVTPNHPVQDIRLLELASAFQEMQPSLSRFAQQRMDRSHEIDMEAGNKAALANKLQFKDAVNKGVIPAGASPWFKVAWERQKARVASDGFDRELRNSYALSGLSEQDDPKKFDGWVADFTSNWQEMHPENKENPEFTSVFGAAASKSQEALANVHAALRTQKIEADVEQNTGMEIGDILADRTDLLGNNDPNTATKIAGIVNQHVANGLNGQVANKLVAQAVVRHAIDTEDLTALDILSEVPSGSGTVGQIGFVKDMVASARDQIASAQMHGARLGNLEKAAKRTEAINSIRSQAYAKIADNPYADTKKEFADLNALDPDEAAKVESFRTSYLGSLNAQNKVIESGPLKTSMIVEALHGRLTEDDVTTAVEDGRIDADTAKDLLTNHMPKGKGMKDVFQDPMIIRISNGMKSTIKGNDMNFTIRGSALAEQAEEVLMRGMSSFKEQHPKATSKEIWKEATELRQMILEQPEFREGDTTPLPNAKDALQKRQAQETVDNRAVSPSPEIAAKVPLFKTRSELQSAWAEFAAQPKDAPATGRLAELARLYKLSPAELVKMQHSLIP